MAAAPPAPEPDARLLCERYVAEARRSEPKLLRRAANEGRETQER